VFLKENVMQIAEAIENYQSGQITDEQLLAFIGGKGAEKLNLPLNEAIRLQHTELQKLVGKRAATKLSAAFEFTKRAMTPRTRDVSLNKPEDVFKLMRPKLAALTNETFWVILLDARYRFIRMVQVAEGGLASCAIAPRDVFAPAIREDAPAVLFVHNHPSGDPTPSRDDIHLTQRLSECARLLSISLIDHVVVADGGFSSLIEMGKL